MVVLNANYNKSIKPKLSVGFVLARNFTLSAFAAFVDTLRLAADENDKSRPIHCSWDVLSDRGQSIRSSSGLEVLPTARYCDGHQYDYIAVVGGLLHRGNQLDCAARDYLLALEQRQPIVGLCTGSFVLAELGLLKGRSACVSWFHIKEFRVAFPSISATANQLFLLDGNCATCAGGVGTADLAAHLVALKLGSDAASKAMEILQINRARSATDAQARKPLGIDVTNPTLARALLIMEQNISDPLTIRSLAKHVGLSTRQLERLSLSCTGSTPSTLYSKIRLDAAIKLVRTTRLPLLEVALETGFASGSGLSRAVGRQFGCSPKALRTAALPNRANIAAHSAPARRTR